MAGSSTLSTRWSRTSRPRIWSSLSLPCARPCTRPSPGAFVSGENYSRGWTNISSGLFYRYDSVTVKGDLLWQNELNEHNRAFFDGCDGIFTNYTWKEGVPTNSAANAKERKHDVYSGIDCFGRGTFGGGGLNTWKESDDGKVLNFCQHLFFLLNRRWKSAPRLARRSPSSHPDGHGRHIPIRAKATTCTQPTNSGLLKKVGTKNACIFHTLPRSQIRSPLSSLHVQCQARTIFTPTLDRVLAQSSSAKASPSTRARGSIWLFKIRSRPGPLEST